MAEMNKPSVKDKVIIVTGASKGIGLATSRLLAEKGAQVVLAARDPGALKKALGLIEDKGGSALDIPTDICREDAVRNLITQVKDRFGRIDVLINNAGILVYGPVTSTRVEDWDRVIDTNLKGAFLCSRAVLPIMIGQGFGQIINVVSGAGKAGFPNLALYCASKFGLVGFSKALAKEVSSTPVKISCLYPGYTDTEMLRHFPEEFLKEISPAKPEKVADQILRSILYPGSIEERTGYLKSAIKKGAQWIGWKKSG